VKHALWSVWKETGVRSKFDVQWCVQFPHGIVSLKYKKDAEEIAAGFEKEYEAKKKAQR
jgi:hypothetical protein